MNVVGQNFAQMIGQPRSWFSPAELADMQLPGLPRSKRNINEIAQDEKWALQVDKDGLPLARKRAGKGGGIEYHIAVLPAAARTALAIRTGTPADASTALQNPHAANDETASSAWHWFDRQSEKTRQEAARRLAAISQIVRYEEAGMSRSNAVDQVASESGTGSSTLWSWLRLIAGLASSDWLPALAPQRKGGGKEAEVDAECWQALLSDYLRLSKPSWETCYRRTLDMATARGITLPHSKTLFRKFEREIPPQVIVMRRDGVEALRRMLPPQIRSVAHLHALEIVNIDGHKADVFVRWPDGRILRPTLVAIQDVYSRKFLSWRVAESEDMVTARLVFADLFAKWGIPKGLLSDNGRAFASKWLTGGAQTRFRFKIRDEDPMGLLTALGIKIHWAKPYRGQSKPIERGFRDFCDAIAKHPAFEGAYTGNSVTSKPENYGNAAVDLETFIRIWDAGIAAHNRQVGRRTEMGGGKRSFDDIFEASYTAAAIGKATEEQLRLALLAADQISTDRKSGAVIVGENRYWCAELAQYAGQKVTVRFDPEDLTKPVHVYSRQGGFLVTAPLWEKSGFDNMAEAAARSRLERRWKKAAKQAETALNLLSADELVAKMPVYDDDEPSVAPTVLRPVRHRGQTAAALKIVPEPHQEPLRDQFMDQFSTAVAALRLVE